MTQLSVNINKVATLRNARGGNVPDVLQVALDCERYGAQGITVHPRPDGRHIRHSDVYALKQRLTTEFNIEGYPAEAFMRLVTEVRPAQVTLVPDSPEVLTSAQGWRVDDSNREFLASTIAALHAAGCRVSVFVDPEVESVSGAASVGADRIELYTGPYAEAFARGERETAVAPYVTAAVAAHELGLGVNAGHDLNLDNLRYFVTAVPDVAEVSIGHALISDALYLGLKATIAAYRDRLANS